VQELDRNVSVLVCFAELLHKLARHNVAQTAVNLQTAITANSVGIAVAG
jgi:hypothetical protein